MRCCLAMFRQLMSCRGPLSPWWEFALSKVGQRRTHNVLSPACHTTHSSRRGLCLSAPHSMFINTLIAHSRRVKIEPNLRELSALSLPVSSNKLPGILFRRGRGQLIAAINSECEMPVHHVVIHRRAIRKRFLCESGSVSFIFTNHK